MKSRDKVKIKCSKCGKNLYIRADYLKHHLGFCNHCRTLKNKFAKKHGQYKERIYRIWSGLFQRRYKNYNPSVCKEWNDFKVFMDWSFKNGYSDDLTIDRINKSKDYCPENCQWITLKENAGKDKIIFKDDEKKEIYEERIKKGMTQIEFAKYKNVSRNTIQRLEKYIKQKTNGEAN